VTSAVYERDGFHAGVEQEQNRRRADAAIVCAPNAECTHRVRRRRWCEYPTVVAFNARPCRLKMPSTTRSVTACRQARAPRRRSRASLRRWRAQLGDFQSSLIRRNSESAAASALSLSRLDTTMVAASSSRPRNSRGRSATERDVDRRREIVRSAAINAETARRCSDA